MLQHFSQWVVYITESQNPLAWNARLQPVAVRGRGQPGPPAPAGKGSALVDEVGQN